MGLTDRFYNLAKGYLGKMSQQIDAIDKDALRELDDFGARPQKSAAERAQEKIERQRAANAAAANRNGKIRDTMDDLPPGYEPPIPQIAPPGQPSTLDAAYKVLGIAPGSAFAEVKKAYENIKSRLQTMQLAQGSAEQKQAERISQRIEAAFMLLAENLDSSGDRFERLEL